MRLSPAEGDNTRGRLRGVKGANLYRFIGEQPPTDIRDWHWAGETVRTRFTIRFPQELPPGSKVYITAQWKTARGQTGPAATPLVLSLPGGAAQPARYGIVAA